jgi:hypothetical protein
MLDVVQFMVGMVHDKQTTTGGGWWRLTASILAVVSATVGFGYYLPLRQANQLLGAEFDKTRKSQGDLTEKLSKTAAELTAVTAERDVLRDAKTQVEQATQSAKERIQQLTNLLPTAGQPALKAGTLKLTPEANTLFVDVFDKTWLTPAADGLTRNGNRVLCPFVTEVAKQPRASFIVRSFAPDVASSSESRWAGPGRLATGVAEGLVARCKVDPSKVAIASSPTTPNSPLLQLEFHL